MRILFLFFRAEVFIVLGEGARVCEVTVIVV